MSRYSYYTPYVPVAKRRVKAAKLAKQMTRNGEALEPVVIEGRKIASTFWGKAWCENLEAYSDYESRLPRGRTYARNGSVIDLKISKGEIQALISGSDVYRGCIKIDPIPSEQWKSLKNECAGKVGSLIELLSGKISKEVMTIMTDLKTGLFPKPKEIHLNCSCPDFADLCKHLAAVLYGIGARLDAHPELLFLLRSVNHEELIDGASLDIAIDQTTTVESTSTLSDTDLSDIFGISLDSEVKPYEPLPLVESVKKQRNITQKKKNKSIKTRLKKKTLPKTK